MLYSYASPWSCVQGDTVALHLFGDAAVADVEVTLDSAVRRVLWRGTVPCHLRGTRAEDVSDGVDVAPSCSIATSVDWPSGVYLIRIASADGHYPATGFFVVRPRQRAADILLVLATNTYNAYNHFGGANIYLGLDHGHRRAATRVSFRRPLMSGFLELPDGMPRAANVGVPTADLDYALPLFESGLSYAAPLAGWAARERVFAHWAAAHGIALDYATNADLETHPTILEGYRLVLSVGHDEYWSWGMRDTLEAFVAQGGNVAFLSGNTCFWQMRYTADGTAMDAYKGDWRRDPVLGTAEKRRLTGIWAHPRIGRPESQLTGLSYVHGGMARMPRATPAGSGGYTVYQPDHWCFEGTGLTYGDLFGASGMIVAYECDGCRFTMADGLPVPTGDGATPAGLEILALSPVSLWSRETIPPMARDPNQDGPALYDLELTVEQVEGDLRPETLDRYRRGHAVVACYTRGGTVFNAGTTDWTYGLAAGDRVVERITLNVLTRLAGRSPPPAG